MRQKRAPPRRLSVADRTAYHLRGEPAYGPAAHIEQPRLAREGLTVLGHTHHVTRALSQTSCAQDVHVGGVSVQIEDFTTQPPCNGPEVDLGFHDDSSRNDVKPSGETQERRHLGSPAADLSDHEPAQLVLHLRCHGHEVIPSLRGTSVAVSSPEVTMLPSAAASFPK